jgi:hypothetical protein
MGVCLKIGHCNLSHACPAPADPIAIGSLRTAVFDAIALVYV